MKNENITLMREQLHQLVWCKSMLSLAKDYGLSDKGLAKICDKMEIAWPQVVYWSKVYSGAEAKIPKSWFYYHKPEYCNNSWEG
jgi:hypothetical protein